MGKNKTKDQSPDKKSVENKSPVKKGGAEKQDLSHLPFEFQNPSEITLFSHPLITLKYAGIVLGNFFKSVGGYLLRYWYLVVLLLGVTIVPYYIDGPHKPHMRTIEQVVYFILRWVVLGIASSIGLGTGLHTFVLYLGPWIAKVTMVANDCRSIPEMIPNKWAFERFADCPKNVENPIGFWDILLAVQFEAFLWGLGTAIGELPPYFMARAAAQQKKKLEELEEIDEIKEDKTLMSRIKLAIFNNLQKYGFITVLLCASIPNPLFDLAGITCGHFGIPFWTFFGATSIGKAIIKVHIQMVFVIFVFSKDIVDTFLKLVEANIPSLQGSLSALMEKQRQSLHNPVVSDDKPLIAQLWDYFITAMIVYFLYSILTSFVQQELQERAQEAKKKKK